MDISLTGDRPTGHLHLGHYVGSLQNRLDLQDKYDQYIMVADVQGLTDYYHNPALIAENVYNVVEDYIACGLSVDKNTIFVQSQVSALTEISMYYMNLVSIGRLQRNPTVKAEMKQKNMCESVSAGFLCYPVSQAADITAFRATVVPVGEDQIPMIEQTNEIVRKFNSVYGSDDGDILVEAKALLSDTSRLPGIDGKAKASKSLGNAIYLTDSAQEVHQKVMMMYTDPNHLKVSDPGMVEGNVVFTYLDAFYPDKDEVESLKAHYRRGGLGDTTIKGMLSATLNQLLEPMRERRGSITRDYIRDLLHDGCKHANERANDTLMRIRQAMHIKYF